MTRKKRDIHPEAANNLRAPLQSHLREGIVTKEKTDTFWVGFVSGVMTVIILLVLIGAYVAYTTPTMVAA